RMKVQNNTVGQPQGTGIAHGIQVSSGTTTGGSGNPSVCVNIANNTTTGEAGSGGGAPTGSGIGLRKQGTDPAVYVFGVHNMTGATSTPAVENFVQSANPSSTSTILVSATSGFTSCTFP